MGKEEEIKAKLGGLENEISLTILNIRYFEVFPADYELFGHHTDPITGKYFPEAFKDMAEVAAEFPKKLAAQKARLKKLFKERERLCAQLAAVRRKKRLRKQGRPGK